MFLEIWFWPTSHLSLRSSIAWELGCFVFILGRDRKGTSEKGNKKKKDSGDHPERVLRESPLTKK